VTLDEAARLAGGFAWAEARLFEVLGAWVATTPEPEVKLMLDRHSHHHAWRAEQWQDRLPAVAGIEHEKLTIALSPAVEAAYRELAGLETTVQRLAGAYRFALPRLATGYATYRVEGSLVSDGSGLRTARIVEADIESDWHEGELALQHLIGQSGGGAADTAAQTVAGIERLVLG
jgi:hypothetical protein